MLMIVASEVRFKKFLARSARQPSPASYENCFILFTREHGSSKERHEQGGYYVTYCTYFRTIVLPFCRGLIPGWKNQGSRKACFAGSLRSPLEEKILSPSHSRKSFINFAGSLRSPVFAACLAWDKLKMNLYRRVRTQWAKWVPPLIFALLI